MVYDLTILSLLPNRLGAVLPVLPRLYDSYAPSGKPLGCFACEFGALNRFALLSSYENLEALHVDRVADMRSKDAFGIGEHLGDVDRTAFEPLPFMAPIEAGSYGPFYEFRTYSIAPGGLAETAEAWSKVMPRRQEISKLLMVMGSIEGAPTKMVHIWPYNSIEDRMKARKQASNEGIWPPPGGSNHLTNLQSELFVATAFSDLK